MWASPFLVLSFLKCLPFSSCCGHPELCLLVLQLSNTEFLFEFSPLCLAQLSVGACFTQRPTAIKMGISPHAIPFFIVLATFSICLHSVFPVFVYSFQELYFLKNLAFLCRSVGLTWAPGHHWKWNLYNFFNLGFPKEIPHLVEPYDYITGLSISQNSFWEMLF